MKELYETEKKKWLAETPEMVKDGTDRSVSRLQLLAHVDEKEAFPLTGIAIVQIAENVDEAGDLERAKKIAIHVWNSSSPPEARKRLE